MRTTCQILFLSDNLSMQTSKASSELLWAVVQASLKPPISSIESRSLSNSLVMFSTYKEYSINTRNSWRFTMCIQRKHAPALNRYVHIIICIQAQDVSKTLLKIYEKSKAGKSIKHNQKNSSIHNHNQRNRRMNSLSHNLLLINCHFPHSPMS